MKQVKEENSSLKVEKSKVNQAVSVLFKLLELRRENDKDKLFLNNDHKKLMLQLCLKKPIGSWKRTKEMKIHLPHSYINKDTDVALVVKDQDTKSKQPNDEETVNFYTDLFQELGIKSVNKIIPLHQLKAENQTNEVKGQFIDLHEVLLVDSRVKGMLPYVLGNSLFKKKRLGRKVLLKAESAKNSIEKALKFTELNIPGHATSCSVQVGTNDQSQKEIIENIHAVMAKLRTSLPGEFINIRQIDVTATNVMNIPLYIHLGSRNEVIIPKEDKQRSLVDAEVVDTVVGAKVKVDDDFNIDIVTDDELDSDIDDEVKSNFKETRVARKIKKKQNFRAKVTDKRKKRMKQPQKAKETNGEVNEKPAAELVIPKKEKKIAKKGKESGKRKVMEIPTVKKENIRKRSLAGEISPPKSKKMRK